MSDSKDFAHEIDIQMTSRCSLICISLITDDVEHFFIFIGHIGFPFFDIDVFVFCPFSIQLVVLQKILLIPI